MQQPNLMQGITQQTLDAMKSALYGDLKKSVQLASGVMGVDLSGPAKIVMPRWTPFRNMIPRREGGFGLAYNWKAVANPVGSGINSMPWVPEGQRAQGMTYQGATKTATYVTLGIDDGLTYEAISASQGAGFENTEADFKLRLLQRLMMMEEGGIIGGNASLALGTPATPSLSASGTGATLPSATYSVIVVALTQEALAAANGWGVSYNAVLAAGLIQTRTITGLDGKTYTLNGGSSNKSAAATLAVTLGQTLSATVAPVTGAVAYAWFVGTAGSETLQQITGVNSVSISAPLTAGRQAATAITADCSRNSTLAFDGLLPTVMNSSNGAIVTTMATNNAGLTGGGDGGCVEIDTILQQMWDLYGLTPDYIAMNSQEQRNLKRKILTYAGASLVRGNQQIDNGQLNPLQIAAGSGVQLYFNPFTPTGDGTSGSVMPVIVHPLIPPGTILFGSRGLPPTWAGNNFDVPAEIRTRRDYYTVPWADTTRQRNQGVYSEEVLAVLVPQAFAVLTNIANL